MRWIIGDIHGMLRPLGALLGAVFDRDPAARCVFVGDYVNRGPESRRVVDLLLSLPNATFLRGNHDDLFDLLLNGNCYVRHPSAPDAASAFAWFMRYGLAETLASYGADCAELESALACPDPQRIEQLVRGVPEAHRRFFRSLEPVLEAEDFFVTHGFWGPDDPDHSPGIASRIDGDPVLRYRLLWGRFTETQIRSKKHWRRTGYFGHTPVHNYRAGAAEMRPVLGPKIVLVDTAVALLPSGMLSAVCAETGTIIQSDRAGNTHEVPERREEL